MPLPCKVAAHIPAPPAHATAGVWWAHQMRREAADMGLTGWMTGAFAPPLLLAVLAAGPAGAAADLDACTLLSAPQVSAILGVAVAEGEHIVPESRTSCGWMGPGGASIGSKKMVLSLMSARAFHSGKTPVKGVTETIASGIGDEAYYVSMPPFGTALSVRKGNAYFQLRIAGFPSAQVRNLEREL